MLYGRALKEQSIRYEVSLPIRVVIYARVSTYVQGTGYSLQAQIDACERYSARQHYVIAGVFTDEYTGFSLDRPGLNQLREFLKANPSITRILVHEPDRLARKTIYQGLLEKEFQNSGVQIEYAKQQYEDTESGQWQKQYDASLAEHERLQILERSKRGKSAMARSGSVLVSARPPYGYKAEQEGRRRWLIIDEEEARIVRIVFAWYLYGDRTPGRETEPLSMHTIALRLTELQIPTRGDQQKHVAKKRGYGVWSAAMIKHILTNETYTGVWHYGKTEVVEADSTKNAHDALSQKSKRQVARPQAEWIAVPVPAIIDRETFDLAQQKLPGRRHVTAQMATRKYLMTKRLHCANCGQTCVAITRQKKYRYYLCNGTKVRPSAVCDMPHFQVDAVDQAIWRWVWRWIEDPDKLEEVLHVNQLQIELSNKTALERVALIEAQLASTRQQLAKLLDLYLNTDLPRDMLLTRKALLEMETADLVRERTQMQKQLDTILIADQQITILKALAIELRDKTAPITLEDKQQYFDLLEVRGKLAVENGEKVVYLTCKIQAEQRLRLSQISLL